MIFLRHASLKRKQTLVIMLTSGVALLLACAGFVLYDLVTFRETTKQHLVTLAEVLGNNCTGALDYNDRKVAEEVLSALRAEPDIVAACIYARDGQVFARYAGPNGRADFVPPKLEADYDQIERDRLVLFRRITQRGEIVGAIYLESNLDALSARLWQYANIAACVLLVSVLVAFLLSARLQRIISGPILQLVRATRAVARQKNYAVRVPKQSGDELGLLIDDFNEMLAQIQARDAALQQAQADLERRVIERTQELEAEVFERKRAEEMLRQQFARLSLLNQIARAVAERQDLASIFSVTLRNLEDHLPIDFGGVYLLDPAEHTLVVAAHGPKSEAWAARMGEKTGETLATAPALLAASQGGDMLNLQDTARSDSPVAQRLAGAGLRTGVLVPLIADQKPLGTLVVARQSAPGFSADEGEFLRMVSEQVALAARQAQLYAELQKAYDELRATQQTVLQHERLRALGQMASGIAHDINNALVPIMGYTDLMLTSGSGLSPGDCVNLTCIKTACLDIVRTVERMKEFYRQRKENEALFQTDLNRLVGDAIGLSRPRWRDIPQERGVVVDMRQDLEPALPPVLGIEGEIRQALVNLILNAVDAMPKGGLLTLRTRLAANPAPQAPGQPAAWITLEVKDTGTGMDEETRRRCLEPFFSTKGVRGTGLGLAMVYGIMERHEGRIEVESAAGQGTTMRLLFPARTLSQPERPPAGAAAPAQAGLRVLCIDDEPMILTVMQAVLTRLGHEVVTSQSGPAGLEALRQARGGRQAFHVVITDLGMPAMDGRAVAEIIKRESPQTKVILLTGWGMFLAAGPNQPANVDYVLSKPPGIKDLKEALLAVMRPEPA